MVNFTILEKKPNYLKFEIIDSDTSLVNAIRRICWSEINFVSVDPNSVDEGIEVNTSPLHNQFIGKRFVLLPCNINPKNYQEYEIQIHDDKDPNEPLVNIDDVYHKIYSDDFKIYRNNKLVNEKPFIGNSLIFALKPGQKFKCRFKLSYNNVRNGFKYNKENGSNWCPVSQVGYKYKTKKDITGEHQLVDDERNYIGIEHNKPTDFIFQIETIGSDYYTPQIVINIALNILIDKLDLTENSIKKILKGESTYYMSIDKSTTIDKLTKFIFHGDDTIEHPGENHTLGNLLSFHTNEMQNTLGESRDNFVGYKQLHQLLPDMELHIKNDSKKIKISEEELLLQVIKDLKNTIKKSISNFNKHFTS